MADSQALHPDAQLPVEMPAVRQGLSDSAWQADNERLWSRWAEK